MGGLGCRLPAGRRGKLLPLDVVEIAALLPLPEGDHRSDRREDRRELEELPEEALLLLSRSFAVVAQENPPHREPEWIRTTGLYVIKDIRRVAATYGIREGPGQGPRLGVQAA